MKHLLCVSAVTLVACGALFGTGPHVPGSYQGTTQITVANAGDRDICAFMIFAADDSRADNWLGDKSKRQSIAPGATKTFSIKPGTYHIVGAFCDGETVLGAVGTYGAATKTIDAPTLIALGPKDVAPVANATTLRFTQVYGANTGGGGGGGGEEPAAEAPAEETPASSSSSSSAATSSEPSKPAPRCQGSGGTCGFENDGPCCAGTKCTGIDANGHGTCR